MGRQSHRVHGHDRSERPERERERGKDGDSGLCGACELENLKEKLADLNERLSRLAQQLETLVKPAVHSRFFFLTGLTRERVKEVVSNYQADCDVVMAGTRDKGLPLKLRIYDAILKMMMDAGGKALGKYPLGFHAAQPYATVTWAPQLDLDSGSIGAIISAEKIL